MAITIRTPDTINLDDEKLVIGDRSQAVTKINQAWDELKSWSAIFGLTVDDMNQYAIDLTIELTRIENIHGVQLGTLEEIQAYLLNPIDGRIHVITDGTQIEAHIEENGELKALAFSDMSNVDSLPDDVVQQLKGAKGAKGDSGEDALDIYHAAGLRATGDTISQIEGSILSGVTSSKPTIGLRINSYTDGSAVEAFKNGVYGNTRFRQNHAHFYNAANAPVLSVYNESIQAHKLLRGAKGIQVQGASSQWNTGFGIRMFTSSTTAYITAEGGTTNGNLVTKSNGTLIRDIDGNNIFVVSQGRDVYIQDPNPNTGDSVTPLHWNNATKNMHIGIESATVVVRSVARFDNGLKMGYTAPTIKQRVITGVIQDHGSVHNYAKIPHDLPISKILSVEGHVQISSTFYSPISYGTTMYYQVNAVEVRVYTATASNLGKPVKLLITYEA